MARCVVGTGPADGQATFVDDLLDLHHGGDQTTALPDRSFPLIEIEFNVTPEPVGQLLIIGDCLPHPFRRCREGPLDDDGVSTGRLVSLAGLVVAGFWFVHDAKLPDATATLHYSNRGLLCNFMVALMTLEAELTDRLLRTRTIVLGQAVDDPIANSITAQLHLLEAEDSTTPVTMLINSPGGSVTSGLAIYDAMQFINCPVATVATGLAASMGQILLCAGATGRRFALPHASIMMHQGSAGVAGVAADIEIQALNLARMKRLMNEVLARHTGQPVETIEADSDRDQWYSPDEAVAYGMIDHVVTSRADFDRLISGGGR